MELVLDKFTVKPLLTAAEFRVMVQLSVPAPVIDALAQVNELNTGITVPLRLTVVDEPVTELLVNVSCPVAAPAEEGSSCTFNVVVSPGFSVNGKFAPEIANPVPVNAAALTVTAAEPIDDRTSCCVAVVFTGTVPNARLDALRVSAGAAAPS
jgi:hypothetical protein